MLNRKLEVKMVKNENENDRPQDKEDFLTKAVYAKEVTKELVKTGGYVMVGYLLLDTFRQVMVEKAKK